MLKMETAEKRELISIFYTRKGKEYQGNRIEQANRPEIHKKYAGPYIRLKKKRVQLNQQEESNSMNLDLLEKILLTAYSYTAVKFYKHQSEVLWSVPSAGACYPVEVYLIVRSVQDVPPGVYYYSTLHSSLHKIANLDYEFLLNESLLEQDQKAAFHVIFTVNPWRSCWKYSYRGYRFTMIDAGHVISNFQTALQTVDLEFSTYTYCRAQYVKPFLHLHPLEEPVAIISVKGNQGELPLLSKLYGEDKMLNNDVSNYNDSLLFDWEPLEKYQNAVHGTTGGPTHEWLASYQTPATWEHEELLRLITKRRSAAAFLQEDIPYVDFHDLLFFLQELEMPFEIYCVINRLEGVVPGVYRFDSQLQRIKEGDFSQRISDLCLSQEIVREAPVTCFFTFDTGRLKAQDLWRFQQAQVEVGALSQLTYLKAHEYGFGYSAIAGYYDEELRDFLKLGDNQEILLAGVLGLNDPNQEGLKRDRYFLNRPGKMNCQA